MKNYLIVRSIHVYIHMYGKIGDTQLIKRFHKLNYNFFLLYTHLWTTNTNLKIEQFSLRPRSLCQRSIVENNVTLYLQFSVFFFFWFIKNGYCLSPFSWLWRISIDFIFSKILYNSVFTQVCMILLLFLLCCLLVNKQTSNFPIIFLKEELFEINFLRREQFTIKWLSRYAVQMRASCLKDT